MKKHYWLVLLFQGLLAIIIGLAAILSPEKTILALTWFAGAFLLFESILLAIAAFFPGEKSGSMGIMLLEAIIGFVAAILIMSWPEVTIDVLFLIFAIWAIATGLIGIVKVVFSKHKHEVNHPHLGGSLLRLAIGFLLLSYPTASINLIMILFGAFVLVAGVAETAFAFKFKEFESEK